MCAGYFGSGLYLTPQARYAASYPAELYVETRNERGELALVRFNRVVFLLMIWMLLQVMAVTVVGHAYPLTRAKDYDEKDQSGHSMYYGKAMDGFFDAHFIRVDPDQGYEAASNVSKSHLFEVVLKDSAQVLPRYVIFFTGTKGEVSGLLARLLLRVIASDWRGAGARTHPGRPGPALAFLGGGCSSWTIGSGRGGGHR